MTSPAPKPSLYARALSVLVWATSPTGRHDLGAIVAALTAAYVALHRSGAF